jgi:Ca2+-binding EF-hand superfamily protein
MTPPEADQLVDVEGCEEEERQQNLSLEPQLKADQLVDVEGCEEEERQQNLSLEPQLKGLTFGERWDVIGSPTEHAFFRSDPPLSPLHGCLDASGRFSGMAGSMKLRNVEFGPKPLRSATGCGSLMPSSGSNLPRLMCKSASTGTVQLPSAGPSRPNHLAAVKEGLLNLRHKSSKKLEAIPSRSRGTLEMEFGMCASESGRPPSAMDPARKVALSEFRRWCEETFTNTEKAWKSLNPGGNAVMNQDDFIVAVKQNGYRDDNASFVFACLVLDEASPVLSEKGFYAVLDSVSVGRTKKRRSMVEVNFEVDKTEDTDASKGSALHDNLVRKLENLTRTDPVVGELIAFLYNHFGTLKLAFRHLDLNGNGWLSMQEYTDGLRTLHTRKGNGPIEVHMEGLFAKMDQDSKGMITLEELVYELENNPDPLIKRLHNFCSEARKSGLGNKQSSSGKGKPSRILQYAQVFKVGHKQSPIDCAQFCYALSQSRYPKWHSEEVFRRLDHDDSGALSLSEFTAFLQPDPPVRHEKKGPLVPLGSDKRRTQVQEMHIACAKSQKLSHSFRQVAIDLDSVDGSVRKERPDWLARVDNGLSKNHRGRSGSTPHSPLSRTGEHVMRGVHESMLDLAPICCGLANFDIQPERCRIAF